MIEPCCLGCAVSRANEHSAALIFNPHVASRRQLNNAAACIVTCNIRDLSISLSEPTPANESPTASRVNCSCVRVAVSFFVILRSVYCVLQWATLLEIKPTVLMINNFRTRVLKNLSKYFDNEFVSTNSTECLNNVHASEIAVTFINRMYVTY